jgi:hypothetical protein
VAHQRQVHRDALVHRGIGAALRHLSPSGFGGDLLAKRREVIRTRGSLDVCEPRRALTHAMHAAPEQSPGRPPGGGIAVGLREPAATEQDSALVGSDLVVWRFATVAGLHGEGMPQDTGNPFLSAAVGEPGPR